MRIAVMAPPWAPVPPRLYGGIELVVDLLARGYAAAGHDVVLYTTGDSTCPVARRGQGPRRLRPLPGAHGTGQGSPPGHGGRLQGRRPPHHGGQDAGSGRGLLLREPRAPLPQRPPHVRG